MFKPKFSLVTVFLVLTVLAIVCAALVRPSFAWANAIWTATIAALAGAVRALRADPEARREMGERGRAYARAHWARERILPAMERMLETVAGRAA